MLFFNPWHFLLTLLLELFFTKMRGNIIKTKANNNSTGNSEQKLNKQQKQKM